MKPWRIVSVGTALALLFATTSVGLSAPVSESEPNNDSSTANPLPARDIMSAAITPLGDEDYFALGDYNSFWGVIALLDTQSGTADPPATLVMLRNDGTTELGRDSGSWVNGSGLAFVPFLDEALTHYYRVYEEGGDATIADYTLRLYPTFFTTKPEVEPNDSYGAGTVTAPTMGGTLASLTDRDCFAFHAFGLEDFVFALDSDPNGDGAQYDMVLEVRDSSDAVIASANRTGPGGTEFIELSPMGISDTYAYCVRAQSSGGGSTAEYKVGLVRNGWLYLPDYSLNAVWTNPRPGDYAHIGDLMTFDMSITDDDPLKIPGSVEARAFFTEGCMNYVSSNPVATSHSATEVSWEGQKSNGINPGDTYAVSMTLRAHFGCNDHVDQSVYMAYYATGTGLDVDYLIWWDVLLPAVMRNAP